MSMLESRVLTGLLVGAALAVLCGSPVGAQQPSSKEDPKSATTSTRKPPPRSEAELDFVDSEQAVWNTRSVNDSIFQPGLSVNSVMQERKAVRAVYRMDFLPEGKVEELEILGPKGEPADLKIEIEGRQVDLEP